MNALKIILIFGLLPLLAHGADTPAQRDGQHDFDWEIGTWKTHLKRLQRPLTGSTSWVEYEGTTVVRKVWDGRANLVELDVKGSAGAIEALSLRLYNPESRQWSLNFSNSRGGTMAIPAIGEFKNGRGEFYNQDTLERPLDLREVHHPVRVGRPLQVRAVVFRRRWPDLGGELDRDGYES